MLHVDISKCILLLLMIMMTIFIITKKNPLPVFPVLHLCWKQIEENLKISKTITYLKEKERTHTLHNFYLQEFQNIIYDTTGTRMKYMLGWMTIFHKFVWCSKATRFCACYDFQQKNWLMIQHLYLIFFVRVRNLPYPSFIRRVKSICIGLHINLYYFVVSNKSCSFHYQWLISL